MKTLTKLIMISALAVCACAKFETQTPNSAPMNANGEYAIVFKGNRAITKASATSTAGNGYDSFNLYAWNALNDTIMNPFQVSATAANAYDYVNSTLGQELKYFKKVADSYDFIGIIPTTNTAVLKDGQVTVNAVKAFSVDDSRVTGTITADSPDEFLWAYKNVAKADYANTVTLPFNHGNAVVYLGFKSDRTDTEIIDYVPGTPGTPAIPGTPATETTESKSTRFIDELVAGNTVQVAMGFIGASSSKLTKGQPNPIYVGSDNTANGYLAKTWLLSIKDAVNAQFEYYRLASISSNDKTPTTEDWESAASNKNIFMLKLADGVNATDFANGNDVFWNALVAHETDWVGGTPAESFKEMFTKAYNEGWRVVRINVSDTNASQVLVFLASNQDITTKVTTITPGTPDIPAVPGTDAISGVRLFTADSTDVYCKHIAHTTVADAVVSETGCQFVNRTTSDEVVTYTLPATTTLSTAAVFSPTTFYAVPGDTDLNFLVVKLSYTYNGVTVYDVRVPIKLPAGGLQAGKYYKYTLNITSNGNGTNDPTEATAEKDEITIEENPVISVSTTFTDYTEGADETLTI